MRILYITTVSDTINAFLVPHIKMLIDDGHAVDIACQLTREINRELIGYGCHIYNIPFQRTPLSGKNISAYKQLQQLLEKNPYDIVHCHTPVASFITRIACRKMRKDGLKVIYTTHGFHFFKGAPLINWMVYYPAEKLAAHFTDLLITVNQEDYKRAKKMKAAHVEYIPGVGLDFTKFASFNKDRQQVRDSLSIPGDAIVLLSVGELNDNKNHQVIIQALSRLDDSKAFYVIAGRGPSENSLRELAKKLGVEDRVLLLGFRTDVSDLYHMADMFMFPSKREGLGMVSLEAMACGLPIVTSNIHGINDYSINGVTGYSCASSDVDGFKSAISVLSKDMEKRIQMGAYNKEAVKRFDINNTIHRLKEIMRSYT